MTIDGGERILGLTERQEFALREIARLEGARLVEVGQAMHARRGKHAAEYVCSFCQDEGASVVHELLKKGLLRRRRGGIWESTRLGAAAESSPTSPEDAGSAPAGPTAAPRREPGSHQSDEIPF